MHKPTRKSFLVAHYNRGNGGGIAEDPRDSFIPNLLRGQHDEGSQSYPAAPIHENNRIPSILDREKVIPQRSVDKVYPKPLKNHALNVLGAASLRHRFRFPNLSSVLSANSTVGVVPLYPKQT